MSVWKYRRLLPNLVLRNEYNFSLTAALLGPQPLLSPSSCGIRLIRTLILFNRV